MDHNQKLTFIANMTDKALQHIASTPNVAAPNGGMSHEKMLSFVAQNIKHGLQHFDAGGTTLGGPTTAGKAGNLTTAGASGAFSPIPTSVTNSLPAPLSSAINPLGFIQNSTQNQFQATATPVQAGTNGAQLEQAYNQAQTGLGAQRTLVNQNQPGITQGLNSQSTLSEQLANEALGKGPNPAQAALNHATGQNIQQQAALAAGQRGAGTNAGLIAAQNAQQGAATQQQAVGQAATLQAQQQLAAQNAGANLAAQQIGQGATAVQNLNQQTQNEQNILQGANTSYNNANVAQQSNLNNVNAQISEGNQQASNGLLGGALNGLSSIASIFAHGGMVKMDKGGKVLDANARKHIAPHNFALPGGRYPIHDINHARNALARVSQNGTPQEKAKVRAAVAKKYPDIEMKKMAKGGYAMMDDGGSVDKNSQWSQRWNAMASGFSGNPPPPPPPPPQNMDEGGQVNEGDDTPAWQNTPSDVSSGPSVAAPGAPAGPSSISGSSGGGSSGGGGGGGGIAGLLALLAHGGSVHSHYQNYFCGGNSSLMDNGGPVDANGPSQKAVKSGDSLKNDKVPAMLSEGEIVIPRHITMGANAPAKAAAFVAQQLAKKGKK